MRDPKARPTIPRTPEPPAAPPPAPPARATPSVMHHARGAPDSPSPAQRIPANTRTTHIDLPLHARDRTQTAVPDSPTTKTPVSTTAAPTPTGTRTSLPPPPQCTPRNVAPQRPGPPAQRCRSHPARSIPHPAPTPGPSGQLRHRTLPAALEPVSIREQFSPRFPLPRLLEQF